MELYKIHMLDIALMKDGFMPSDKDLLLLARFRIKKENTFYNLMPEVNRIDDNDIKKLYASRACVEEVTKIIRGMIAVGVIDDVVLYYGSIRVLVGNYLPDNINSIESGEVSTLGATRYDENSKKEHNDHYGFVPSLVDEKNRIYKIVNINPELPIVLPRMEYDQLEIKDPDLELAMLASMTTAKLQRKILELGIKNFPRTSDTEILCCWCRSCEATSSSTACDHLLFCSFCLRDYLKTDCNKYCPVCLRDMNDIHIW